MLNRRVVVSRSALLLVAGALCAVPLGAQTTAPELQGGLEIKWVRDSEEYAALARMVYRTAERQIATAVRALPRGRPWSVVLDVDETTLDNSSYQLTRLAYRLPFDSASFNEWNRRAEAGVVPGVVEFIVAMRRLGGHVAWITNRWDTTRDATRANLAARGLWNDDDRLCPLTAEPANSKAARRAEVATGTGRCAWEGTPMAIVGFFGDNIQDFPQAGEADPDAGKDSAFGARYFMLPNPMYGGWVNHVTRRDR